MIGLLHETSLNTESSITHRKNKSSLIPVIAEAYIINTAKRILLDLCLGSGSCYYFIYPSNPRSTSY